MSALSAKARPVTQSFERRQFRRESKQMKEEIMAECEELIQHVATSLLKEQRLRLAEAEDNLLRQLPTSLDEHPSCDTFSRPIRDTSDVRQVIEDKVDRWQRRFSDAFEERVGKVEADFLARLEKVKGTVEQLELAVHDNKGKVEEMAAAATGLDHRMLDDRLARVEKMIEEVLAQQKKCESRIQDKEANIDVKLGGFRSHMDDVYRLAHSVCQNTLRQNGGGSGVYDRLNERVVSLERFLLEEQNDHKKLVSAKIRMLKNKI
eukprot:GEMP01041148.1.p1 GENE.GEMP01041148.1~~GEMP01041148.1.p1  ORF type:complete len:263 (+),score=68.66 GEMP01041148.1:466-1254(+)